MRILMQSRRDLLTLRGGDTVQVLETKAGLERLGHRVEVSLELAPDLTGVDLVHLFNVTRVHETYLQLENARGWGVPVALSPIYHDLSEYHARGNYGAIKWLYRVVRNETVREALRDLVSFGRSREDLKALLRLIRTGYREQQRQVLDGAGALLPNSVLEWRQIERDFGARRNVHVAYYAPSRLFRAGNADRFRREHDRRDFVLCAARFGARKNQLALVRALRGTGIPLVLVGKPFNPGYWRACRRDADDGTIFLDHLSPQRLADVFAAAKVHVLPSWFETCGLVSLEAGLAGCNVVTSDRGYTREYCRDYVWYCDPARPASIRGAVVGAYRAPRDGRFRRYIQAHFDWDKTARATLGAYETLL